MLALPRLPSCLRQVSGTPLSPFGFPLLSEPWSDGEIDVPWQPGNTAIIWCAWTGRAGGEVAFFPNDWMSQSYLRIGRWIG